MSQDVTAKMLKPDFDSEVSGLVHGYLFHEQRPPQPIASGEVCARYQALADDKAFISVTPESQSCHRRKMVNQPLSGGGLFLRGDPQRLAHHTH